MNYKDIMGYTKKKKPIKEKVIVKQPSITDKLKEQFGDLDEAQPVYHHKGDDKLVSYKEKVFVTTITKDEWNRQKKMGYTSIIDGKKYMLMMGKSGGTILAPVKVK